MFWNEESENALSFKANENWHRKGWYFANNFYAIQIEKLKLFLWGQQNKSES